MESIQRIPNFIGGVKPECVKFSTLEELLDIKWIKSHKRSADFYRYSLSENDNPFDAATHNLMLEVNRGFSWYVLGHISDVNTSVLAQLPKFKPKNLEDIKPAGSEDNIQQVVKDIRFLISTHCSDETLQARIENFIESQS